jgi:hypothetical protein
MVGRLMTSLPTTLALSHICVHLALTQGLRGAPSLESRSTYLCMTCCRFDRHPDWMFHGAGGGLCRDEGSGESSISRRSSLATSSEPPFSKYLTSLK